MAEGSDDTDDGLPMLTPTKDPARYTRMESKERFAVAKFYGMGSDGEWTIPEIADAMEVSKRQVSRYIHDSTIGEEVREVLATTEAEWRLDMALQLRREVNRLEEIEQELLQRKKAVPTGYEQKTVEGTPTGDRNIRLAEDTDEYRLKLPVPTDFESVTDYTRDLESVQKEKRQYLEQIAKLLGLNAADKKEVDMSLASRHEEVKVVEFRQSDDPYPEAQPVDSTDPDAGPAELTVEPVEDTDDE